MLQHQMGLTLQWGLTPWGVQQWWIEPAMGCVWSDAWCPKILAVFQPSTDLVCQIVLQQGPDQSKMRLVPSPDPPELEPGWVWLWGQGTQKKICAYPIPPLSELERRIIAIGHCWESKLFFLVQQLRTAPGKGDPRAGSTGREETLLRAVLEASEDLDPDLGVGTGTQVSQALWLQCCQLLWRWLLKLSVVFPFRCLVWTCKTTCMRCLSGFPFYLNKCLFSLTVFDCRVEFQSRTVQAQNLDKSFLEVFWKTPLSQTVSALWRGLVVEV